MFERRSDARPAGEKRRLPRYRLRERVSLAIEREDPAVAVGIGEVADLNLSGLRARHLPGACRLSPGATLRMVLISGEHFLPLRAKVVHQRPDGSLGLKFVSLSREDEFRVYQLYANISDQDDFLFPEYIDAD